MAWQKTKAIRLWDKPLPREVYAARQGRDENFGLFETNDDQTNAETLVAVVSLLGRIPEVWRPHVEHLDAPWLATLAVASHGRRIGHRAIDKACSFLMAERKPILYLDCAKGFLENLYRAHGFHPVAEGTLEDGTASGISSVLMARHLVRGS